MNNCDVELIANLVGVQCRPDAAGIKTAYVCNTENITAKTVVKSLCSDLTITNGKLFILPVTEGSFKPKSELVLSTAGALMYKHSVEMVVLARTPAEIEALKINTLTFFVENKQVTSTGGTFTAYGFDCGLKLKTCVKTSDESGYKLMYESETSGLEAYAEHVVYKTSDSDTRILLNGFLA